MSSTEYVDCHAAAHEEALTPPQEQTLTRNERLVLSALQSQTSAPMKAYELLAALKEQGIKAPMTIYRALDRLQTKGLVHKLDGLNAFVVCSHQRPHRVASFLLCKECEKVEELSDRGTAALDWSAMQAIGSPHGFEVDAAHIEIFGTCADCAAQAETNRDVQV